MTDFKQRRFFKIPVDIFRTGIDYSFIVRRIGRNTILFVVVINYIDHTIDDVQFEYVVLHRHLIRDALVAYQLQHKTLFY